MLAVVMNQRIWAGDLIFLANDGTSSKGCGRPANANIGLSHTDIRHSVSFGAQATSNHRPAEIGEYRQNVRDQLVECALAGAVNTSRTLRSLKESCFNFS